jgi:cytidylate kinase
LQERGGGVVLGRAAAVLLREDPRVLRVLLTGPPERRIAQGMAIQGIDHATAARRLERTDRARIAYHQTLYCVDPREPNLYHLVVDSTRVPLDTCVDLIAAAVRR